MILKEIKKVIIIAANGMSILIWNEIQDVQFPLLKNLKIKEDNNCLVLKQIAYRKIFENWTLLN